MAIGGLYYVWKAQSQPGLSYAGIKALGEIYQKKYVKTGLLPGQQPEVQAPMAVPRAEEDACCVTLSRATDPNDVIYQEFKMKTGRACNAPSTRGSYKIKEVKGGRCPE